MNKLILIVFGIIVAGSVFALNTATQNLEGFLLPEEHNEDIFVHSPLEKIYDQRKVQFNITTKIKVSKIEYINYNDNRPRWRRLCVNCDEYGFSKRKIKNLKEGENNLSFRAIDYTGQIKEKNISLFIDSKKPNIVTAYPRRNKFVNTVFTVEFQEENPKSLLLYYGNESDMRNYQADLGVCYESRRNRKKCDININLMDYDLQKIAYYFKMIDIANNSDESRKTEIRVDVSKPVINEFNYTVDKRKVYFKFNVTDENFDEINYLDNLDINPRWRRLCSRLKDGICERKKTFIRGDHNVSIEILDKAGNSVKIDDIVFSV